MTPVHAITDLAYRLTLVPNLAGVVSPEIFHYYVGEKKNVYRDLSKSGCVVLG